MATEEGGEREALRVLVGQLKTNLAARGRSGLLGVSLKSRAAPPAVEGGGAPRGTEGLKILREEIGDCQRCKLAGGRTQIVYGVGNPDADLVFVGEAPGADEDAQGEPFVGKAGQLLTKMIEAMGYERGDVYICNVLKCRPPGNLNP